MNRFSELQEELVTLLAAEFSGECTVMGEYPGDWRRLPPRRPCIAVGLSKVEIEGESPIGTRVRLGLRFDILCPAKGTGGDCHAIFERICTLLARGQGRYGLCSIDCGEVDRDRDMQTVGLTAGAVFRGMLAAETSDAAEGTPIREVQFDVRGDMK